MTIFELGVKYIDCLLFKKLYTAGLAGLSQGLGMKGTSETRKDRNGVRNYMQEMRGL